MRRVVHVVVLALALIAGQPDARADQKPRSAAEVAFAEGQSRYNAGEFLLAAERFERAYALEADPAYLFNIAQAYRLGSACAKAAATYRRFLATLPSGSPNIAKVDQLIEQSDACAKKQDAPVVPPTPPPVAAPARPVEPPPVEPARGNAALRYSGIAVGVLGVATVVFGGYNASKVGGIEAERERLCADGCMWGDVAVQAAAIDQRGARHEQRAMIGLIAGPIAILAGAGMYLLGRSSGDERSHIAIVPADGGAMAVGSMRF